MERAQKKYEGKIKRSQRQSSKFPFHNVFFFLQLGVLCKLNPIEHFFTFAFCFSAQTDKKNIAGFPKIK